MSRRPRGMDDLPAGWLDDWMDGYGWMDDWMGGWVCERMEERTTHHHQHPKKLTDCRLRTATARRLFFVMILVLFIRSPQCPGLRPSAGRVLRLISIPNTASMPLNYSHLHSHFHFDSDTDLDSQFGILSFKVYNCISGSQCGRRLCNIHRSAFYCTLRE